VRLDAKMERPEQRFFSYDHIDNVLQQRGALIGAALTIIQAYLYAGAPNIEGSTPYGSFSDWDRMVRRPLLWLDLPDPLKGSEALRDQDPDLDAMRLLFAAWFNEPSLNLNGAATTAEIVNAGIPGSDLYDPLQLICSEKPNTRRLGYWLRAHCDRIVDGMQLKKTDSRNHMKVVKWFIAKV